MTIMKRKNSIGEWELITIQNWISVYKNTETWEFDTVDMYGDND